MPQKKATPSASRAKRNTSGKKTTAKKQPRKPKFSLIPEKRHQMIQEAAYYIAQNENADPLRSWLEAENQIDSLLAIGETQKPTTSTITRAD